MRRGGRLLARKDPASRTAKRLQRTFECASDRYESARPSYPEKLFDDLVRMTGLKSGSRLLEIGCGTGKATQTLAQRGFAVVCVELGPQLAAIARQRLARFPVEIHVSPFETWPGEPESFDLVYAATAWHWIDAEIRYRKAHDLLRPGGHLAFWSAAHAFPEGFDSFFSRIQEVYDEIGESYEGEWPPDPPEEVPDEVAEIESSGLFGDVQISRYVWQSEYSADDYIRLLDTFSGHIAMEAAKREHLYGEIRRLLARRADGQVRRHWQVILHVARRS